MANWILVPYPSAAILAYTASANNEAADHPATNVGLVRYPARTWEATTAVDFAVNLDLDLGSAQLITDIVLTHTNFGAVSIYVGDDGVSFPTLVVADVIHQNYEADDRRQAWLTLATPPTKRYVRIQPWSADAGVTGFAAGNVFVLQSPTPLAYNPGWPVWTPVQPVGVVPFDGDAREVQARGPVYLETRLRFANNRGVDDAHLAEVVRALRRQTDPFLLYRNNRSVADVNSSQVYFVEPLGPPTVAERFGTFQLEVVVREVF